MKRRILTFRKTKSNRVRYVPIHSDLYAVLMRLEPAVDSSAPLFPREWNGPRVSMAFRRASRRAGLTGFRLHDLRHDFCSWLTMREIPMRAVQKLARHAGLRITEPYSHLSERVLVEAVAALPALPTTPPANGNGLEHSPAGEVLVGGPA
jgi:integrase